MIELQCKTGFYYYYYFIFFFHFVIIIIFEMGAQIAMGVFSVALISLTILIH